VIGRGATGRRPMAIVIAGVLACLAALPVSDAVAVLGHRGQHATPYALARPLWTDVTGPMATGPQARAALRVIDREQRQGVLRDVLGPGATRLVAVGKLQDHGRTIGASALLALPVARHDVRAIVPGGRFVAPVLRDLLVDVDLRSGAIVSVAPGPASQTSSWRASPPTASSTSAVAAASGAPQLVRLSPGGPSFAPYDGTQALGPAGRDWPVSLVFTGHATVAKVKRGLRRVGFTHLGESRWLAYSGPGGGVRYDSDHGLKTAHDANGTDVHVRLYAPPGNHFTDPRFGEVVVATVHLDRGEAPATPPSLYGFSEEAERRVADALAGRLGWQVQRDGVALGNAEPFRHDLAAPDHVWWSDGRATLISVP
jgi:hypothetical protein